MKVLAIDIGSYSIKVQEALIEKKKVHLLSADEIILDQFKKQLSPDITDGELVTEILLEILEKRDDFDKIIYQLPSSYIVTRYITLPVKSKKKAQQILPFQLEDGLFSNLDSIHYITKFIVHKTHVSTQTFMTKADMFNEFYEIHNQQHTLPNVLASEHTIIQDYVEQEQLSASYAILDIGHKTTKAYIINNHELVANHLLYFGGEDITKLISTTYQISYEEAEIYKKENAFFLTEKQYDEVDEEQKEFALFMKSSCNELIKNIQIWDLGYQSLTGKQIGRIYLIGGSSKIKNFANFLSQNLNIKCDYLPPCKFLSSPDMIDAINDAQFQMTTMMSSIFLKKQALLNFLHGNFAGDRSTQLPLYTIAFIGSRIFYLSTIFIIALSIQLFMTQATIKKESIKISKKLKSPALGLKRKEKRLFRKAPERLLRILQKKEQHIKKAYSALYNVETYDLLAPLYTISNSIEKNKDVVISYYSSDPTSFKIQLENYQQDFSKADPETLKTLTKKLTNQFNASIKLKLHNNRLIISGPQGN